jgi:nitrogen fixation protein NifB
VVVLGQGNGGRHPCFHAPARGRFGRVHLPVARSCNIACGYCKRDHDCVNESRPGVTSRVMGPDEALAHLDDTLARMPFVSVAGIAGPGDPFAEPETTLRTLALIRQAHPDLILCVSTNGLGLVEHVDGLADLEVGFVTVTVNAVDPAIGRRLCGAVRWDGQSLHGEAAAGLLAGRQMEAIARLKQQRITVKVNTVVVPGLNDRHVAQVAEAVARLGADRMNLIGLIPVAGTPLGRCPAPAPALLDRLRAEAEAFLPQMRHCARCRADAAGLLGADDACGGAGGSLLTSSAF